MPGVPGKKHRMVREHKILARGVVRIWRDGLTPDIQQLDRHSAYVTIPVVALPAVRKTDPGGNWPGRREYSDAVRQRQFVNLKCGLHNAVSFRVLAPDAWPRNLMNAR